MKIVRALFAALLSTQRPYRVPRLYNLTRESRRNYYENDYLKSDAWKRKRFVVLRRDNFRCVYCGARATQVHHLKYARNIGREPIDWLVSVCNSCHNSKHS